ncbi:MULTISPECIES: ABC transporter permease [Acidithiobacillus]|jgi:peptide/nickel transport system permease protein|uniref:ABC transporter permease n=2 Tax=Acidithiobacillus ferrooxidans TaxID=920 RepID=A0A2W1KF39_ACIFR|nr:MULTISPECIES: ABC transporter permease [Acidithiobacillus]ACH84798.1 binding-protein-dependent transport systems inner membrane component [Acidithiobacillus ferrooxidans ATCC 53993]MBN6743665.1 ABC transporter permease [Acidithiobacillus sp. MC2.2]MBN6746820.1 ABC transporter permease [Acidithiobacillus sp. PG05]MBU2773984.1 ABC transporter permease [Acidithiobacillus ferrooxidans]MBU2818226.1 ABC transporter permease [Acidithiobacillus ferrooxidans]
MMRRMILNRLGTSVLSLFLLVTIVFLLIHATPGGPAYSILGMHATPEAVAALNKQMGLDHPIWQQYGIWWEHLFEGNLGYSFTQHAPVASLMGSYLANSIILYVLATVIAVLFSVLIGMFQGYWAERTPGVLIGAGQIIVYSIPTFFIGVMLILFFAIYVSWFPPGGIGGEQSAGGALNIGSYFHHMVLPAITIALPLTAGLSRYFGHQARSEYRLDYVRTARARGVPPLRVALNHVLRNAIRPLVTVIGMMIPGIFVGGILTESVFNYPGLGWLLWRSALEQDYPTLSAIVLLIGVLTILGNLAADLTNSILDVRVRYE